MCLDRLLQRVHIISSQVAHLGIFVVEQRPGFGEFVFEERADQRSVGRFRDIKISETGGLNAGEVDVELYTDFSAPFNKKLPFKVGKFYELALSDFDLKGILPDLGELTLTERAGTDSTCEFDNIQKDAAGENVYGTATFRLYAFAEIKLQF